MFKLAGMAEDWEEIASGREGRRQGEGDKKIRGETDRESERQTRVERGREGKRSRKQRSLASRTQNPVTHTAPLHAGHIVAIVDGN